MGSRRLRASRHHRLDEQLRGPRRAEPGSPWHPLLSLQADAGNAAVTQLVQRKAGAALTPAQQDEQRTLTNNGLGTRAAWFRDVKRTTILGLKVEVHTELANRLRTAEADLVNETPPEGGWSPGGTSTRRPPGEGLHSFGLAIDISPGDNPYLHNPAAGASESNDSNAEVQAAIERAVLLVQARTASELNWRARPSAADPDARVEASYDKLESVSNAMKTYFTLDQKANRDDLETAVAAASTKDPLHRTADQWVQKIRYDRTYVGKIASHIKWADPSKGVLTIDRRLVRALTRSGGAGLTWLGDDTIAGGRDIMHFDTRHVGPIHSIFSTANGSVNLGDG